MKAKQKKKGFTLVELLAALVILGLLTMIAAPNILGILQNTKLNTYARDAEKLVTTAEYKFRSDTSVTKPANGKCIIMNMKYLGSGEFKSAPFGGSYTYSGPDKNPRTKDYDTELNNFVVIRRVDSGGTISYEYHVQLVEYIYSKTKFSGVALTRYSNVKEKAPIDYVNTGITSEPTKVTKTTPTTITVKNADGTNFNCPVVARYAE